MRVRIQEMVEERSELWVRADSAAGTFWAKWENGPPEVGDEREVELDIRQRLRLGETIRANTVAGFRIRGEHRGEAVTLTAKVLAVFVEQETVQLQIGDSALHVEVDGHLAVGSWVECVAFPLRLYDVDY
jgi:hypothetical protein